MDIEQRLNAHIALAEAAEDLHLHTTLALARYEIHKRDREISDLQEQIRGARGLLELRKERIEDLLRELGQEESVS